MDNLDKQIGEKLKKLRSDKKLTMREVSRLTDIDYTYISKIENGKIPSLEKLKTLCDLYEVPISYLFGDGEMELPKEIKDMGVGWISFVEELKKRDLDPEEARELFNLVHILRKL